MININKNDVKQRKEDSINKLNQYIDTLLDENKLNNPKKASVLSYWLNDWITFLEYEANFDPKKLISYSRGDVIKAHLGFNVGSEEGGLHYCVVVDKNPYKSNPNITVVPLTSYKNEKQLLQQGNVFLDNELYELVHKKINLLEKTLLDNFENEKSQNLIYDKKLSSQFFDDVKYFRSVSHEIGQMKKGSIALVNQIRTISKIRIYNPKSKFDTLHKVKLSSQKLDLIDNKLKELFIK